METRGQIKQLTRMVRFVDSSTTIDLAIASETLRSGVSGYLLRSCYETELLNAIREVLKCKRYISALIMDAVAECSRSYHSHLSRKSLTGRQREVLKLLAEGRTMKEIAYVLTLTPRTVAFHKYKLMERLGLQTNADLIQYAIQEHNAKSRRDRSGVSGVQSAAAEPADRRAVSSEGR